MNPPLERERVLDELRRKMSALVQTTREISVELPWAPRLFDLGLSEIENERGPLWQRRQMYRLSERVGRCGLFEARDADASVLALLALDAALEGVDFSRSLYLDTETTGLGGGSGTVAFLIGLAYFEDGRLWFEQLFLEGPEQEGAALVRLTELLGRASSLVSFNGKAFDWPLLEGRYVMNRMPVPKRLPHLDLLHVARRIHAPRIRSCTLKNVESQVLGFERYGDIDGMEVSSRYGHYLRSGDASALGAVLEHNAWDVASLAALVGLYGEPIPELLGQDLAGVARTFRRSRALERAGRAADAAVARGGGAAALRARAEVYKALGDRLGALSDFEAAEAIRCDPEVRLELAKLYEHFLKDPNKALSIVHLGTTESESETERRRARLERKLQEAPSPKARRKRR